MEEKYDRKENMSEKEKLYNYSENSSLLKKSDEKWESSYICLCDDYICVCLPHFLFNFLFYFS